MTNYESIYPGNTFLLDPEYQYMGHRIPAGELGATTSIQTANQLKEVSNLLNQGIQATEISVINPEVFEMMPKDHLKEINRLNKLTGAESTMHAPTLDPSGFTQQGWSKSNREVVEKQFTDFVERTHELDPNGNIPVTIHASVIPGSEMMPATGNLIRPEERGKSEVMQKMIAVDQESGQFIPLERDLLYSHHQEGPRIETPQDRLDTANNSKWVQAITNLAFYKKEADEILVPAYSNIAGISADKNLSKSQIEEHGGDFEKLQRADLFLDNVDTSFRTLFEQAAKYPNPEYKKETKKILGQITKEWKDKEKVIRKAYRESPSEIPVIKSNLIDKSLNLLRQIPQAPLAYKKVEDFATEKASETLSNVALNSYKKFGNSTPIISIENPPYGSAISDAESLKGLIVKTRKKFTKKLMSEGLSQSQAKEQAKKLVGATWDTSHMSMIRKQGFGPEKITEETKKIAPYIKHVHLNDNFGSTHTDLPPGKGNLPMPEIMKELEKAKFKGKKIFEGGNFFQHFQTSPMPYVLESAGSPLYSAGGGIGWNQLGGLGAYYSGQGAINPSVHHSTYGAGFTTLPVELGGEMPGGGSRFSGTPNQ